MNFHVSLTVRVLDDYTGKSIENFLSVMIQGEKPPIMKNNGYYIFVDLKQTEVMLLQIKHPQYREVLQVIEPSKVIMVSEIIIRLTPNFLYQNLDKITAIRGFAEPLQKVNMRCLTPARPFKLWRDYEWIDYRHVYLYNPRTVQLAGKSFQIENKGINKKEIFKVLGLDYANKWKTIIETPLCSSYPKTDTCLYPIYETYADENGCFLFCIWEEIKKEGRCIISVSSDSHTFMECSIEANKMNDVSFK